MESSLAVPETKRKRLIFAYDYMGRRIKKAVCGWSTSLGGYGPESSSYRYVYDGWNLVAELQGGRCLRTCTWGQDLSGSLAGAGGIGGLVFVRDWNNPYVHSVYPAYDGNGNLTAMINAEDGTLAASYEYSPYGELLTGSGPYASDNPFRFSTKYTDGETGLAYFGYRYYNPETGRWLNRDPIEEDGGLNLYVYVDNVPTKHIDLNGLSIYKCIRKTNIGIGNHAYLWDDTANGGKGGSCGMGGISGGGATTDPNDKGPNKPGQYCVKIPGSEGKEGCVMGHCGCHANDSPIWFPPISDCHTAADRSLKACDLPTPPLPRLKELWKEEQRRRTAKLALGG